MPRKPKVLVADDSLTVRKMIEMLLVQDGYEVVLAETGAKCLALCASSTPDLLLLDFILPDMRGVEVCQVLMNSPSTWEIPVLLMSGNGNAIRQLYQDMNNVADYLTKPFPPNVLKAVVAHVLQKTRQGKKGGPLSSSEEPTELRGPDPSGQGMLPASTGAARRLPSGSHPAGAQPGTKPPVPRREVPEAVIHQFRQVLQKHWQTVWHHLPEWEQERGSEAPETFYQDRFFAAHPWKALGSDLLSAAGLATSSTGAFRCPASLVTFDSVLQFLHARKLTGEWRVELGEETVHVFLSSGEVVFLGSNHPRRYCAGAGFGFQQLTHAVIARAVQAQETFGIPFFVTVHHHGALPDTSLLQKLLRDQGERAVLRAFQASDAIHDFRPLDALPEVVEQYRLSFPVWHLLLVCYRSVDDWFTIEQTLPGFAAGLSPSPACQTRLRQLHLNDPERRLLDTISPSRTLQDIVEGSGLEPYVASQVLYRFLKLGMFFSVPRPEEETQPVGQPAEVAQASGEAETGPSRDGLVSVAIAFDEAAQSKESPREAAGQQEGAGPTESQAA